MKVLIVGFSKIRYMPYIYFHLDKYKDELIDIVTWNRDGTEDIEINQYKIHKKYEFDEVVHGEAILGKIPKFYSFRKFVKNILNKNVYDRIVLMHTFPAFLLSDILMRDYQNKYIFDYKDVTYEKFLFFKKRISKIVENSAYTLVSSKGFLEFLPKSEKIYISHNLMKDDLNEKCVMKEFGENINISFWGMIRDYPINEKLIKQIKNMKNCTLTYYGTQNETSESLSKLVQENNVDNVSFKGTYNNQERRGFCKNVDFIHNMYSTSDYNMNIAMSNKFYDGVIFHRPQICTKGSLMGDLVEKYNLGFAIDIENEDLQEKLQDYCSKMDYKEFDRQCDLCLQEILKEYEMIKALN